MAEFLLKYFPDLEVVGLDSGKDKFGKAQPLFKEYDKFVGDYCDLADSAAISNRFFHYRPDYFINLAGVSEPHSSWIQPNNAMVVNTLAVITMLESIKNQVPNCRFFSAGSSLEMGSTTFHRPESPYALSKVAAGMATRLYRKTYGLYATHGTLFNHTSPRSKESFVVCKITKGVARIFKSFRELKEFEPIELHGDIYSTRDWSDSREIVRGIWATLNQDENNPMLKDKSQTDLAKSIQDYELCSGKHFCIKDIVEIAFKSVGLFGVWKEDGFYMPDFLSKGCNLKSDCYVKIDPKMNHTASHPIYGDKMKALIELSWQTEIPFDKTIANMVESFLTDEEAVAIH